MSKKDITRRESLKKIAVTAYAAPATVMLLTSKRAVAQSDMCVCALSGIEVNCLTNMWSATRNWLDCANIDRHRLRITGPGIVDLAYTAITSNPNGSYSQTNVVPYDNQLFQCDSTYTFTLEFLDSSYNVFQTCQETFTTPPRPN